MEVNGRTAISDGDAVDFDAGDRRRRINSVARCICPSLSFAAAHA